MTDEYPYEIVARYSAQKFRGLVSRHLCVLDHDLKLPAMVWGMGWLRLVGSLKL